MAAPHFLPPPNLTADVTGASTTPAIVEPVEPVEHPTNEFLQMLQDAMPVGGTVVFPTEASMPGMARTENNSATYSSSTSACLDFFFQVVPQIKEERVVTLLEQAWKEDALTALKLVLQLRGVRGTGKSDKENFYRAAMWLHKEHPQTLFANLEMVASFGYFKDLLELVLRLVEGIDETTQKLNAKEERRTEMENAKRRHLAWKSKKDGEEATKHRGRRVQQEPGKRGYYARKGEAARLAKELEILEPQDERIADSLAADKAASEKAAILRKKRKLDLAKRVTEKYESDTKFQEMYKAVARVFARQLLEDRKALKEGRIFEISLAAKWAPSLDSSYDLRTLLCYGIACQMFPKESCPEYQEMEIRKYGYTVRDRLRKDVLVPIRKVLELPEVFMSANKWAELNYRRVASVAIKKYKDIFMSNDKERFSKFLEAVKSGKEKIAAGALLPHEIVRSAVNLKGTDAEREVAELQWTRLVDDLKQKGSLSSCLPVCDVSGSMSGIPMEVCIALGLLLSELSEEPWKGHVITFSAHPEIHRVEGEKLVDKYNFTRKMDWGCNTNFQLVFDRILAMATAQKLAPEKMVKRLFVFSDMEFDEASENPWETDYQAICRKFEAAGYGTPPDIIFWNLRDSEAKFSHGGIAGTTPVLKSQPGVAMVSGFSKNILKVFLQEGGDINPIIVMQKALSGAEYDTLRVFD